MSGAHLWDTIVGMPLQPPPHIKLASWPKKLRKRDKIKVLKKGKIEKFKKWMIAHCGGETNRPEDKEVPNNLDSKLLRYVSEASDHVSAIEETEDSFVERRRERVARRGRGVTSK
ncbi:hypothetical protein LIER_38282 [Lithospermum erythrorhizon]|uniref:Uncharacterized protein n=1 Tax=Lithospermum erythrorhizon TaxID=34254 RepID=A0AAV3PYZ2_LITER